MDNNTTITDQTTVTQTDNKGEKTFSQDDVNRIVQERLSEERQKTSDELSKKEQELAQKEFRLNSRQKLIARGYDETLLDALNCSNEEAFDKALDIMDGLIKQKGDDDSRPRFIKPPQFTGSMSHLNAPDADESIRKAMGLK